MRRLIFLLAFFVATGCASLAPERSRPALPVPEAWSNAPLLGTDMQQSGWRDVFRDPALQELIATALQENRSLRQAIFAMDKARALAGVARADRFPTLDASGRSTSTRTPADLRGGESGIDRQWSVNLGLASYELDFFGRVRNLEEAALERYLATEEARRTAHMSLVMQVARTYLLLVGDREGLTLAQETLRSREATLFLTQARVDTGVATDLERYQAEEAVAVAQSEVARLEAAVAQDENALAVLTGIPVQSLHLPATLLAEIDLAGPVAPGLSSDLLTRRADILEAEHMLWAAGAEIGAARAAFFPRITLTASAGLASLELNELFDGAQRTWNFAPSISLPIFDAGRRQANLEAAEAEQKIRIARYEEVIQNAFQEVADALAKERGYAGQVQAQARRVASAGQSRILVDHRYTAGLESLFAVHDAERTLFSARQNLLAVRLSQKLNTVDLFAALGGGWEEQGKTE
ncbi:MAG: efflux transporter outer membrane subunit [Desulfovibrionales bacterium]|nr:efflux transporter outer membrane subunit [Desulfovibrionales bacterium]